jgi:hypothetical protein
MKIATTPEMKAGIEKALAGTVLPKTQPAFLGVELERDGTVWIGGYLRTDPPASQRWWARFDPAGKLLGTMTIPDSVNVVRFSRGYALLSRFDPDTEGSYLSVHRIEAVR